MVSLDELFAANDKNLLNAIKKTEYISDIYDLAVYTNEIEERSTLAKQLNCPKHILYYYAKLANLLQCPNMELRHAEFLVKTGVRCMEDLYYLDTDKYLAYIKEYGYSMEGIAIDDKLVNSWIEEAIYINSLSFQCEASDPQNTAYTFHEVHESARQPSTTMGVDLKDIISGLGAGLADAQKALDMNSIAVQQEILSDPRLSAYGLNATWYTIPETTFSLKMTYSFSNDETDTVSGELTDNAMIVSKPKLKMNVIPSNATHSSIYKNSGVQESTLTLRFLPIPPPEGITDRVLMPNLLGLTVDEAIERLADLGLEYELVRTAGKARLGQDTEVVRQSISAGAGLKGIIDVKENVTVMGKTRIQLSYTELEGQDKIDADNLLKSMLDEAKIAADAAKESATIAEKAADSAISETEEAKKSADRAEKSAKNANTQVAAAKTSAAKAEKSAKSADASAATAKNSATSAVKAAGSADKRAMAAENAASIAKMSEKNISEEVYGAIESIKNAEYLLENANMSIDALNKSVNDAENAAKTINTHVDNARKFAIAAEQSAKQASDSAMKAAAAAGGVEETNPEPAKVESTKTENDKQEKTEASLEAGLYQIRLVKCASNKVSMTKVIRKVTGWALKESKDVADNVPCILNKLLSPEEAENARDEFEKIGAVVEVMRCKHG